MDVPPPTELPVLCQELRRLHVSSVGEEDEDRLGALPDDVLRLVLCRLDTRSALSRQWSRLARELPTVEFKVSDVLPERYSRYLRRRLDAENGPKPWNRRTIGKIHKVDLVLGRYVRRGMRSLAGSLCALLKADAAAEPRRRVQRLGLEIFRTHNTGILDRLITTIPRPSAPGEQRTSRSSSTTPTDLGGWRTPFYNFPHGRFDIHFPDGAGEIRLKRLKLTNCAPHDFANPSPAPAPARAFGALALLVLQDTPRWTPSRVYKEAIRACPALEVLHLKSYGCDGKSFTVDPHPRITELVISLRLRKIDLRDLPRLERLAFVGAPVELKVGAVPRLARLNLRYHEDANGRTTYVVRAECHTDHVPSQQLPKPPHGPRGSRRPVHRA
ncbi:hypothetical protein ACQ4PT_031025 [Festuca glaucescens]